MTMMMKISLLEEVASEAVEVATTTLMMRKDSRREIKDRPSDEEEAMVSQDHSEAVIEVASEKKEEVIKAEAVLEEKKEAALEVEE
jgi:wyosine [tRNA(Phe)-imidazoG37] synthetase (radical SAM superfamily)